ncbi:MAG: hypothetical protein AB1847_03840 [bacterium]
MSSALTSVWEICKAIPCKSRGLYVGCMLLGAYWAINIYRKKSFSFEPVKLEETAIIVICSEGITTSAQFLFLILNSSPTYLGNLKDYRLHLFLGTLAIILVSLKSLSKIFSQPIIRSNKNSNTSQSIADSLVDSKVTESSQAIRFF